MIYHVLILSIVMNRKEEYKMMFSTRVLIVWFVVVCSIAALACVFEIIALTKEELKIKKQKGNINANIK